MREHVRPVSYGGSAASGVNRKRGDDDDEGDWEKGNNGKRARARVRQNNSGREQATDEGGKVDDDDEGNEGVDGDRSRGKRARWGQFGVKSFDSEQGMDDNEDDADEAEERRRKQRKRLEKEAGQKQKVKDAEKQKGDDDDKPEKKAKKSRRRVVLRQGKLGMKGEWETGKVTGVERGEQADAWGVKVGWRMVSIDGEEYKEEKLDEKIKGRESYEVEFEVEDGVEGGVEGWNKNGFRSRLGDGGGDEDDEGVRVRRAPKAPTKKERKQHEAVHEEYKEWCRHCVRGRGRNRPHRRIKRDEVEEERRVPRISLDYNFAGEDDEDVGTWLTMVDSKSRAVWTRIVESKGVSAETEWVVLAIVDELDDWGYRGEDLILRSDQEGAIEVIKKKVAEYRVGKTMPE